jgi:Fe-S-cluster containining protein
MRKIVYQTPEELKIRVDQNMKDLLPVIRQLKKKKPPQLDDKVHALHEEAFDKFSCLDCANCCKTIGPRLIPADIERMARFLKMKIADFESKYITRDEDGDLVFNSHPCPFLMHDNYCMVYEQRPRACREYPHTDRKRFYQILDLSLRNCETCPVVCAIMEELKENK